ncbi:MAG TPA: hypothetical protein VL361_15695 [Candidatus Limnocylindrales bacterium]|jgi:hypothetical protein|nr:hypothetical protein [Candidatus Limnocylindrales bacterium]
MKHQNLDLLLIGLFVAALSSVLTVTAGHDLRAEVETAIKNLPCADSTLAKFFSMTAKVNAVAAAEGAALNNMIATAVLGGIDRTKGKYD